MYKLLLSWRYLRTRYIALASIISVTLGVATLIVVNSVMAGFTREMHKRLHGILSDIVFESHGLDGFPDPEWHMQQIRQVVGDDLEGITAVVHVPAMLNFQVREQWITRQINLIGIDDRTYASVSDFGQYLLHPENRRQLSFLLREDGYAPDKPGFPESGWKYRRLKTAYERAYEEQLQLEQERIREIAGDAAGAAPAEPNPPLAAPPGDPFGVAADPFTAGAEQGARTFDPMTEQFTGIILGIAIGSVRHRDPEGKVQDFFLCRPGDEVQVLFPSSGAPPKPVKETFTIVDFYESKMSEYDSSFAFVPISKLQDLRMMIDPQTGVTSVTSIQLKLRPGADLNAIRDNLQRRFPPNEYTYRIQTWRDMQGPLLAAVQLETTILNILLFLIIAVAGFGILATFFMIVVEKTRDVGILKALGAPSGGVMSIFLSYGLSLGLVGSGVGMVLGLLFVWNINDIAAVVEWITGREVFDPTVYYFREIPTIINPLTVAWVMAGSVLIAVLASVLPARHAARLHPVEALRYE
ncbi:MAG: ABC transporter permease [Pirellulaceae bacterium]|nr:ABC transporter permease [Pirellulaceae bacterium]